MEAGSERPSIHLEQSVTFDVREATERRVEHQKGHRALALHPPLSIHPKFIQAMGTYLFHFLYTGLRALNGMRNLIKQTVILCSSN